MTTSESVPGVLAGERPDRVPGFTVGETVYTFPAHVPAGWGLTYLRLFYGSGVIGALVWAFTRLLVAEQALALETDPGLTADTLREAVQAIKAALLGEVERDG